MASIIVGNRVIGKRASQKAAFVGALLATIWLLVSVPQASEQKAVQTLESPNYRVFVFMSASWMGGRLWSRFVTYDNEDIREKDREEAPLTFAYIKGPNVEMIFGPGPRKETVFSADIIHKGSFDFVDQKTLLTRIGVNTNSIKLVVIPSACFAVLGGIDAFPNATFIIQKKEFDAIPTAHSDSEETYRLMQLEKEGRLEIIDGDHELATGINAHLINGHSPGTQCLSVNTADGLVVLAGFGAFTYENLKYDVPNPFNIGMFKVMEAYKLIRKLLGDSDVLFVPGFDMEVFRRFPKIGERVVEIKLR